MFFLLVVLLLNYADSGKDAHSLRLRTQLRRVLHTPDYRNVSRYGPARSPSVRKMRWKGSLHSSSLTLVNIFSRVELKELPFLHFYQRLFHVGYSKTFVYKVTNILYFFC